MEEFANLQWRIADVSVIDIGTNFISEEAIAQSCVFLDNYVPSTLVPEDKPKSESLNNSPKPKLNKNLQYPQQSRLNAFKHKQCLEALQLLESGRLLSSFTQREQQFINIYNNLKAVIAEENAVFLKFVEEEWNTKFHNRTTKNAIKKLHEFLLEKRQHKFELIKNYPKFYTENNMIPLIKNQNCIEMTHEGCLLELGVLAKLTVPDIKRNNKVPFNPKHPWMVPTLNSNSDDTTKLSVSNDIYAEYLAKQSACNIVISSSSLKTIIDNFGTSWDIPIVVKEHIVNGKKLNIVYVDKTLPQRNITSTDLNLLNNLRSRKILIKRLMCNSIAHRFEIPNFMSHNLNAQTNKTEISGENDDNSDETIKCSTPSRQKLNLSENMSPKTNDKNPETTECFTPPRQKNNRTESKSPPSRLTRSATKKISETNSQELTEGESNDENPEVVKQFTDVKLTETITDDKQTLNTKQKIEKAFVSHHNVNYRLWKLKPKDEENILIKNCQTKKEIKLLVRSKIDACQIEENGKFTPISLVPKLEYQAEHGATMVTKSELLRQWTTLYFRPFSNLLRVRISPYNNTYLKIENLSLNRVSQECMKHYNFNPKDNLGVLFNVLSNMTDLNPGNYILHHEPKHGTFAALLKSVPESSTNSINLHDLYKDSQCIETSIPAKWIPIDTTIILPSHIKFGLMPGLFPPQNSGNGNKGGKKKRKFKTFAQRKKMKMIIGDD